MKKILMVLIAIIIVAGSSTVALAEGTATADTVIVYEQQSDLAAVQSMAESFGKTIEAIDGSSLLEGGLDSYNYIILLSSKYLDEAKKTGKPLLCVGSNFDSTGAEEINAGKVQITAGELQQTISVGGKMTIISSAGDESYGSVTNSFGEKYPLALRKGNIWLVPYFNTADISSAGLSGVMGKFFNWQGTSKLYVMIDEVYAFSDLEMVKETAEALHQNGLPFIIRVMPVYQNTEYPAFKRWAQLLRYVQSIGGSVVLHEAMVQDTMQEKISLEEVMQQAKDALINENVDLYDLTPIPYSIDFSVIKSATSPTKEFAGLPMNTMIVYSLPKDQQGIASIVNELNGMWLMVSDYKRNFTDENTLYDETPYDEEYQYTRQEEQTYQEFFTVGNNFLMVIVGVSIVVLSILFVVGRHLYRKKFARKKGDF